MPTGFQPFWPLLSDCPVWNYIDSCVLMPHTSPLMPHVSHLTPRVSPLMPHTSPLMSHASDPAERAAEGCMYPTLRGKLASVKD